MASSISPSFQLVEGTVQSNLRVLLTCWVISKMLEKDIA